MNFLNRIFLKAVFSFPVLITIAIFTSGNSFSQSQGEQIFKKTCIACHTIGSGRLVGPDLKDVDKKQSEDWIINFVKSSQGMVKSGDPDAVAIFNEFNKTIMPDQALTDDQIKDVILYIKQQSTGGGQKTMTAKLVHSSGMTIDEAGKDEVLKGKNLFLGNTRLTNRGPACISCHNVNFANTPAGGLLALDLTNTFSKLSATGISAIISNPPFPVMNTAYMNHSITQDEAFYLVTFLKQVNHDSPNQQPVNYQSTFLYTGIIGTAILFGLFGWFWWNRKRKAVNHEIYKRQLKSI